MCGIFFVKHKTLKGEKLIKFVDPLSKLQKHRGPDDHGSYAVDDVCFFHERLSIIDLTSGHQPIHSENKEGNFSHFLKKSCWRSQRRNLQPCSNSKRFGISWTRF
jgi:asparagine synthetase B (glutamine-hydrolysing)